MANNETLENPNSEPEKVTRPTPKTKKAKPSVEGINAPRSTNDIIFVKPTNLTDQEKKLVAETGVTKKPEPRLLPQSVSNRINSKPSAVKWPLIIFIILVVLGFAGYELYNWYFTKSVDEASNSAILVSDNSSDSQATTSGMASTTPFDLAGGSIASSTQNFTTSSSTLPGPSPTLAPALKLKINNTETNYLNVRSAPSGSVIGKVHPGEVYTYTAIKNDWYQIILAGGKTGWVSGQYITKQ